MFQHYDFPYIASYASLISTLLFQEMSILKTPAITTPWDRELSQMVSIPAH